jgi:hypothetical protein
VEGANYIPCEPSEHCIPGEPCGDVGGAMHRAHPHMLRYASALPSLSSESSKHSALLAASSS